MAAVFDDDPANILQIFRFITGAHHGLVAVAERPERPVEPVELFFDLSFLEKLLLTSRELWSRRLPLLLDLPLKRGDLKLQRQALPVQPGAPLEVERRSGRRAAVVPIVSGLSLLVLGAVLGQLRLLDAHRRALLQRLEPLSTIVELGPGNGEKLKRLLEGRLTTAPIDIHLVDVSSRALETAALALDGLENVRLQPVRLPRWVRGHEWARVVSPVARKNSPSANATCPGSSGRDSSPVIGSTVPSG